MNPAGQERVLYNFTGGADGCNPEAGVIRDSAGNLYGTTFYGGAAGAGVVFKVNTSGQESVLYSFTGGADGSYPGPVIWDSAGDLYGTTYYGGAGTGYNGAGVVYKLDSAGQYTPLYSFTGGANGSFPNGVIRDAAGSLYGTTGYGGPAGTGLVFQVNTAGQETVLYSFPGAADGSAPFAGVSRDAAGDLYGTAGGGGSAGFGVVYKLAASGETVLYTFTGGADGGEPTSGIIRDSAGNIYGTTNYGGAGTGSAGAGVFYKLDTSGHETVLYTFTGGSDGAYPGGVITDSTGNFYGTTSGGGTANMGVVYKVDSAGHETVLYSFTGGADGGTPGAGVIRDSAGNLYGTTIYGGKINCGVGSGCGVVFKLDTSGQETVLYRFSGGSDGSYPHAGVVRDSAGNLYGTAFDGGTVEAGVVYKVDTTGHETVLYQFQGADGANPIGGVIRDAAGDLYGTTVAGGPAGKGVVYELDAAGHETVLYSFTGGADGGSPTGDLIRDSAGNLYGTTQSGGRESSGVVFKLTP
jgi:uncharacterized repeat protein (TIGR03803 family)